MKKNLAEQPERATIANDDGSALASGGKGKPLQNLDGFANTADLHVDGVTTSGAAAEAIAEVGDRVEKGLRVRRRKRIDAFVL